MFAHSELVGHPIGQKVYSTKGSSGWMYPLRATPELLTSGGLAHRTQLVHSSVSRILTHTNKRTLTVIRALTLCVVTDFASSRLSRTYRSSRLQWSCARAVL